MNTYARYAQVYARGGGLRRGPDGTGEDQDKVKFLLKVKTMQDFCMSVSNITTWLLTLLFPRFPNDFPHVRKEREVV